MPRSSGATSASAATSSSARARRSCPRRRSAARSRTTSPRSSACATLDVSLFAPGHGEWITDPRAKIDEYVAHRADSRADAPRRDQQRRALARGAPRRRVGRRAGGAEARGRDGDAGAPGKARGRGPGRHGRARELDRRVRPMNEARADVIETFVDAWNRRDLDSGARDDRTKTSSTSILRTPSSPARAEEPTGVTIVMTKQWEALGDDARLEIDRMHHREDQVITEARLSRGMPDSTARLEVKAVLGWTFEAIASSAWRSSARSVRRRARRGGRPSHLLELVGEVLLSVPTLPCPCTR